MLKHMDDIEVARRALNDALKKVREFLEDNPTSGFPTGFAYRTRALKRCVNLITCGNARLSINLQTCGQKPIRSMWRKLNMPCFKCRRDNQDVQAPALLAMWLSWQKQDAQNVAVYTSKIVSDSTKCYWDLVSGQVLASNPFKEKKDNGTEVTWLDVWSDNGAQYLLPTALPLKTGIPIVFSEGGAKPFVPVNDVDRSALRRLTRSADGMVRPSPRAWGATTWGSRSLTDMCVASNMLNAMTLLGVQNVLLVSQGYDLGKRKATVQWFSASCGARRFYRKEFTASTYEQLLSVAENLYASKQVLAVWMPVELGGSRSRLTENFTPTSVRGGVAQLDRTNSDSTIRVYVPRGVPE